MEGGVGVRSRETVLVDEDSHDVLVAGDDVLIEGGDVQDGTLLAQCLELRERIQHGSGQELDILSNRASA
jgi:hypothetical protein